MKKYLLLLLVSFTGFAQNVNNYKYLVVPVKFDFQSEINQYRLNSNIKYLLSNQGFTVLASSDILPVELAQNKCKAMYLDIVKKGSFMVTKMQVVFKDCQNNVLFTSAEGRSKEKQFEPAYKEAIEGTINSIKALNYKYDGSNEATPQAKAAEVAQAQVAPVSSTAAVSAETLFAQPVANGYQLVDRTPKIVLKLVKTSQPDYFMATADNKQGVVYRKANEWFFDYYLEEKLISEKLEIKF